MITYPTVNATEGREYLQKRREGSIPTDQPPAVQLKSEEAEEHLDVGTAISKAMSEVNALFSAKRGTTSPANRDELEGLLVEPLHRCLVTLPPVVLSDRDFWRYLCLVPLFDFATWRDHGNKSEFPGNGTYGCEGASLHADTISARMFARGEISVIAAGDGTADPYELARRAGSDIWKSHIMRTLNWQSPFLVQRIFAEDWDSAIPIRQFIKRVKKVRANVLTELLDEGDAKELVERERAATSASIVAAANTSASGG